MKRLLPLCLVLATACNVDNLGEPDMSALSDAGAEMVADDTGCNEFDPRFLQISAIIRPNCLLGGCHGNPPGAVAAFHVPQGMNATETEIYESMTTGDDPLVVPCEGDASSFVDPPQHVDEFGWSETEQESVRAWIEDGAQACAESVCGD